MALEVIEITPKHRELLNRLSELIPDLDPNTPASLQRVFGLGLIALTMQVTNRARQQRQDARSGRTGRLGPRDGGGRGLGSAGRRRTTMKLPSDTTELFRLQDQVALVTGGTKGLGLAMATALSGAGAAVAITSRHLSEAESVAADISEQTGGQVLALQADAGQLEQVEDSVDHTLDSLGQLDILVNNAGINIRSPLAELSDSDWEAVIATNLTGPILLPSRRETHARTWVWAHN